MLELSVLMRAGNECRIEQERQQLLYPLSFYVELQLEVVEQHDSGFRLVLSRQPSSMPVAGCEMVRAPVPRGAGSRHSASTSEMVVSIFSSRPFSPRQHHPSSAWPEPWTMACLGGPRCCAFVCDVGSRQLCPRWFRGSGRVHHLAPNTTPQIPAVMTASDGINRSHLCSSAPYGSKVIFRETIRGFNGL